MNSMRTTASPPPAPVRETQPRRSELDWWRVFVVLALIPIHAAGLFTVAADQIFGTLNAGPVNLSFLTSMGV